VNPSALVRSIIQKAEDLEGQDGAWIQHHVLGSRARTRLTSRGYRAFQREIKGLEGMS
jgi:hypothetical protein